jgi:hypothetical protein
MASSGSLDWILASQDNKRRRAEARIDLAALGPSRAPCENGPTGHNLLMEGFQMAKKGKTLKKGKKLAGAKTPSGKRQWGA